MMQLVIEGREQIDADYGEQGRQLKQCQMGNMTFIPSQLKRQAKALTIAMSRAELADLSSDVSISSR